MPYPVRTLKNLILACLAWAATAGAVVPPVEDVHSERLGDDLQIRWTAPASPVDGYRVYRGDDFECTYEYLVYDGTATEYLEPLAFVATEASVFHVHAYQGSEESPAARTIYLYPTATEIYATAPYAPSRLVANDLCSETNLGAGSGPRLAAVGRFNADSATLTTKFCASPLPGFVLDPMQPLLLRSDPAFGPITQHGYLGSDPIPLPNARIGGGPGVCPFNLYAVQLPPDHDYVDLFDLASDIPQAVEVRLADSTPSPCLAVDLLTRATSGDPWVGRNVPLGNRRGEAIFVAVDAPALWTPRRCGGAPRVPAPADIRTHPRRGGNAGNLTVRVLRRGGPLFDSATTVRLERLGEADINGGAVTLSHAGASLLVTFNLTGAALGDWDVVVTGPGPTVRRFDRGLTVEPPYAPAPTVSVTARPVSRTGFPAPYVIQYRNERNNDIAGMPLWLRGIPADATWSLREVTDPPVPATWSPIDWTGVPYHTTGVGGVEVPIFIPLLAGGVARSLVLDVTVPTDRTIRIEASLTPSYLDPGSSPSVDCLEDIVRLAATLSLSRIFEPLGAACDGQLRADLDTFLAEVVARAPGLARGTEESFIRDLQAVVHRVGDCQSPLFSTLAKADVAADVAAALEARPSARCGEDSTLARAVGTTNFSQSVDPNEKAGPQGTGAAAWVRGDGPMSYVIYFENLAAASWPAQQVVVEDFLDPTLFDFTTVEFGALGFDTRIVNPGDDASGQALVAEVDLKPLPLLAEIRGGFDVATGRLEWRFRTLDAATRLPTTDPLAGFLPPNRNPPEGQGFVSLTVEPKATTVTGDVVRNGASIVFDTNAPIVTNVWSNTLDRNAPSSQVTPITPSDCRFKVEWSGSDLGSGVDAATVLVAVDGGPWATWLERTTVQSTEFVGSGGHSYAFASVAFDACGNEEPFTGGADTTVVIPPTTDVQPGPVGNSFRLVKTATGVKAHWMGVADGYDYVVVSDLLKDGSFARAVATGSDGAVGLGFTWPAHQRFLKVAARSYCGQMSTP